MSKQLSYYEMKENSRKYFNTVLIDNEKSKSVRIYCKKLYGNDFRQFNQMTELQFKKICELLKADDNLSILDIGCGNGRISEYISDLYDYKVLGVDLADEMIRMAQKRTEEKKKINFKCQDIDDLEKLDQKFDRIISIDSIDFDRTIKMRFDTLFDMLKTGGEMIFVSSVTILKEEPVKFLEIDELILTKILKEKDMEFSVYDFSGEQTAFWKKSIDILDKIRIDFEKEGVLDLYKDFYEDSEYMLETLKNKRQKRYLFHIRKN